MQLVSEFRQAEKEFLCFLKYERVASLHTLDAYSRDIKIFRRHLEEECLDWRSLEEEHICSYVSKCFLHGVQSRTQQRRLSSLRSFYRFCLARKWVVDNPLVNFRSPKSHNYLPKCLNVDETQAMLGKNTSTFPPACSGKDSTISCILDVRDKTMIELAYSCGLRVSEVSSMKGVDLDLRHRLIRVVGKGNKQREIPVGRKACEAVSVWLRLRSLLAKEGVEFLFVSRRGDRMTDRNVQKRMALFAKKSGLPVHLHPHMLRHSCASHLLQSSGDLRAVQEFLGHSDVKTTQIYTRLDFQHLASIYDKAHPRARLDKGSKN